MNAYLLGIRGELLARRYLKANGYRVVASRYRAAGGEIDLIARKDGLLVFFEVKYRPSGRIGAGAAAVDADKRRRVRRAAEGYMQRFHPKPDARFDILDITAAGVNHYPGAF